MTQPQQPRIRDVSESTFDTDVLAATKPVLLQFWAPWCGPCKMLAPVLEKVAKAIGEQRGFARLNADEHPSIAYRYRLSAIPCLILFEDGEVVNRIVGFVDESAIVQMLDEPRPARHSPAPTPADRPKTNWPQTTASAEIDLDTLFEIPKTVPIVSRTVTTPEPVTASAPPPASLAPAHLAKVVGYARASDAQTARLQLDALRAAGCAIIHEEAAGSRSEFERALADVGAGDTLVVWRLDRLGKSLRDLIEIATALHKRGAALRSLSEDFDTSTASGRLSLHHVLGGVAGFAREILKERTIAGMQAAKQRGKHVGRPSALTGKRLAEARQLIEDGKTQAEVARIMHVSSSTIRRARLSRYSPRSKAAGPVIPGGVAAAQLAFEAKQARHKNDPFLRWLRGETVEGFKGPMISRGSFGRKPFQRKPPPPPNEAHKERQRHLWSLIAKEAGLDIGPWSDETDRILRAMHALGYEIGQAGLAVSTLPGSAMPPIAASNSDDAAPEAAV